MNYIVYDGCLYPTNELYHYGVKGMKGVIEKLARRAIISRT